ncbi:hypothetical protein AB0O76_43615 [Streptomyces sp. NPDC086554]|uniref:hypothetical protein n=1 Tax=Streptomyces sp. NPDC086554 TaxID=3154864 RepID=UPI00341E03F6
MHTAVSVIPPASSRQNRPTFTEPIRQLLDAVIAEGLGVSVIWAALIEEQDITILYARLRSSCYSAIG